MELVIKEFPFENAYNLQWFILVLSLSLGR